MNASDLARLELAKRAFHATEPTATEVQRGVRRARLALQRPKSRRRWFSKGAVMLVLAVGGLAYAKPQALNDFVASALESSPAASKHAGQGAVTAALAVPRAEPVVPLGAAHSPEPSVDVVATPEAEPAADVAPHPAATEPTRAGGAKPSLAPHSAVAPGTVRNGNTPLHAPTAAPMPPAHAASPSEATSASAVSGWGRVAQALAQGDESKALSALSTLSESSDQRTRDKADIGRAQLFLANGDHEGACALARDLTRRNAGGRIDRQAQAILKSCQ